MRALQLDPFNLTTQTWFGIHLMFLCQYDAAIAQAHKLRMMQPDSTAAHVLLQAAFYKKGMLEEQLAEQKKVWHDPELLEALDRGYARGGYREAERTAAETLAAHRKQKYVDVSWIAVCYTYAGEKDRALEWLEKAYAERDTDMVHIGVAPDWDSLRSDSRFQDLLRRMNFPP